MRGRLPRLVGRAEADGRLHAHEARPAELRLRGLDGPVDPGVIAAVHRLHVPAVRLEPLRHVLAGEGERGLAVDGDAVVVVEVDEPAELVVAREARGLRRDTLHEVAVGDDRVDEVVGDRVARAELRREHRLPEREPDAVREALAERAARHLDAGEEAELRVPRGAGVELPELLEIVERDVEAGQVQEPVQQHRAVAGGEDEAVPPEPARLPGIEPEVARPQDVRQVRGAHRQAGVTAVRLLDRVCGQHADRVHRLLDELGASVRHGGSGG